VSATGRLGEHPPVEHSWPSQIALNVRATLATLCRRPRRPPVAWPDTAKLLLGAAIAVAVVITTMYLLDAWSVRQARGLPAALLTAAGRFTDLGKSGYFLWPLGILMLVPVVLYSPAMPRFWRGVLAAWSVRIGFVFTAIALPSLFDTVIKNMIGRARPFVVAGPDVWAYAPFTWHARYASFPSGHATTAFAALVAIGAIFPQARALMWIYAVLIALSRVVITAHHPSDVIGGAIVGTVGALMVRNWFAVRRLGFTVADDGSVRALPGPSLRRIVKAVDWRPHSAEKAL
jgi:membrane-associated phospholipid phosphatase